MNRKIKFRGIDKIDKVWCYGFLYIDRDGRYWITTPKNTTTFQHIDEVIPKTVGQFSGLLAGKKEIFQGDLIKMKYWHNNPPSKRPKKKYKEYILPVCFDGGSFHPNNTLIRDVEYGTTYGQWYNNCELIGNIHENRELLNKNPDNAK